MFDRVAVHVSVISISVGMAVLKNAAPESENPRTFFRGGGFLETRVVSRSTLSRTCEGGNKYDNYNQDQRRERDAVDAFGPRDRSSTRRAICGGTVGLLDVALRHVRRGTRRFAGCQPPAY